MGFPGGVSGKEPACQCRRHKRRGFNPGVGKIPWRRAQQPTPVFLPGYSVDRGTWRATVHSVAKSRTRLKLLIRMHSHNHSTISSKAIISPVTSLRAKFHLLVILTILLKKNLHSTRKSIKQPQNYSSILNLSVWVGISILWNISLTESFLKKNTVHKHTVHKLIY